MNKPKINKYQEQTKDENKSAKMRSRGSRKVNRKKKKCCF